MKGVSLKAKFGYQAVLLIVVLAILLVTSVRGIDFGHHWDEPVHLGQVSESIKTGLFLPRSYNYPSLLYDLALLGQASFILDKKFPSLSGVPLLIRLRFISIVVSAAAVIFTYLLALQLFNDKNTALVSAALLAFSWEYAYHIRWIATDCIMVTFFWGSYLFTILYLRKGQPGYLKAAAVFGGLSVSAKYNGAFTMIPMLLACIFRTCFVDGKIRRHGLLPVIKELFNNVARVAVIFVVAFLVTSPGVLLEPSKAREEISHIVKKYKSGGHGGYTIRGWSDHLAKLSLYLVYAVFSHNEYASLVLFAMSALGLVVLFRNNALMAIVFLSAPIIYFFYYTRLIVMIARSYLVLAPFLCVLSSAGITHLVRFLRGRSRCLGFIVGLAFFLMISYNAVFLIGAAEGIHNHGGNAARGAYVGQLSDYMNKNKNRKFKVSKKVADDLIKAAGALPVNVMSDDYVGEYYYVVYASQMHGAFRANSYNYAETTFGPHEVNFNYYPDWAGNDRIVVIPKVKSIAEAEEGAVFADCEGRQFEILSGCWRTDGDIRGYGNIVYWTGAGKGESKSQWVINVPVSSEYELFARWTRDINRATNAPYLIRHEDGVDTVRVNQRENGGQWNSLGVYSFSEESPAVITMNNDADGYVIAGAVKLSPR